MDQRQMTLRWLFVSVLSWWLLSAASAVTPLLEEPIRIVEGAPHCFAGVATQSTQFRMEDTEVRDHRTPNAFTPRGSLNDAIALEFGCIRNEISLQFSHIEDAYKMNREGTLDGQSYNAIRYQQSVISSGYVWSLLPHLFYLESGLGFSMLRYQVGWYGSNSSEDRLRDEMEDQTFLAYVDMKLYINYYLSLHWKNNRSLSNSSRFVSSNQLGFQFYLRY